MSEKPDQFVWSSYWRLAWSQRPSTKAFSPLRGLLAVAAALVQFFYLPTLRVLNEKVTVAVIFVAVYMALFFVEATWNFVFVAPVKLDEARRHQAKNDAVKFHCLKSELQETLERMRPKIGFQLKSARQHPGSNGLDTKMRAEPPRLSLLSLDVWNEGPTHVQVTKLELENVSSRKRRTVDVNAVLVPSLPPQTLDVTAELAEFLAGAPASGPCTNWDSAAGAHHIAVSLHYEGGGTSAETEAKNYQVQVQGSETTPWMVKVSREP